MVMLAKETQHESANRVSEKKVPTFENSLHQDYFTDLNDLNSSYKPKDRSMFVIFVIFVICNRGKLSVEKMSWLQNH